MRRTCAALALFGAVSLSLLASGTAANAQGGCPLGQAAMPRKPPTGAFVPGKCIRNSDIVANQLLQNRDHKYCPATLKYVPQMPNGRYCLYWDEPG